MKLITLLLTALLATASAFGQTTTFYGNNVWATGSTIDITNATKIGFPAGGSGTVTSITATAPIVVTPTPLTTTGTVSITGWNGTNWDTAYSERRQWDGGGTNLIAANGRASLGATTIGSNIFTLTNPAAIRFLKTDGANNAILEDAATFRNSIGAETSLTFSTGLTRSTNTITVNTSQNINTLSNLTSNGFIKTSGGGGSLSVDTSTYLTGNQSITLTNDASGSGTTSIAVTVTKVNGVGYPASPSANTVPVMGGLGSVVYTATNGTGNVVRATNPSITDPNIAGTTTNDSAAAGEVGEYVNSTITSGAPVSFTSNQTKNLTSISLTAGDWDVWGIVTVLMTNPTTNSYFTGQANVGPTTNTVTQDNLQAIGGITVPSATTTLGFTIHVVPRRVSLASTTTYYIVLASPGFTSTAFGGIMARRRR